MNKQSSKHLQNVIQFDSFRSLTVSDQVKLHNYSASTTSTMQARHQRVEMSFCYWDFPDHQLQRNRALARD